MKRIILFCATLLIVVFANAQVNLNNGLMAYYPFSGSAVDSSGNGNNPSFNNATLTTDRFGNANSAYSFDGKSSYMQIPNSATLDSGNSVSISFWIKVNAFNTDLCSGNYLFSRGGTQPYVTNYNIVFGNGPYGTLQNINYCKTAIDTAHESMYGMGISDLTPIHTSTWYHFVFTNNGSTSIMYLNGNIVSAQSAKIIFNTADLVLGRDYPQGAGIDPFWFNGVLDDIRIYNRPITGNEVTALYTAANPTPVNTCSNSNNSQLIIKIDTANRTGFTVDNLTNLNPYLIDTVLGSVRLFAWTNNGANYNYRSLMKYQLTKIPTKAKINSAKLYLYAKNSGTTEGRPGSPTFGTNNAVLLQKFTSAWQASTTSWYSQPNVDVSSQKVLQQSTNTNEDYVVDITDFVQTWVNKPDSNFGFVMRMQTEDNPYNSMIFESGFASDPTRNMRLEICYADSVTPEPTPTNSCSNNNNNQFIIKVDTANRTGFTVDNLTNLNPYLIDTVLGSVRLFAWTNNGANYNYRSLMKYQLTKIPTKAKVNSAKLYLYAKNSGTTEGRPGLPTFGTNNAVLLQKFTSDWQASTTSWYSQPNVDVSSQKVLQQSTNTNEDYVVDITDFVKTWVNKPDSNFGFVMRMQTEDNPYNSMIFESGYASDPTRNMRLEICYVDSEVINCPSKSTQLVIKTDSANRKGFKISTVDNMFFVSDTSLNAIPLHAWTANSNGVPNYNGRALVKYNLESLPKNAIINSANLYLYAKTSGNIMTPLPLYGTNNMVLIQKITSPWDVATVRYNNMPTVSKLGGVIIPQSTSSTQDYVIDLKNIFQSWVNKPDSNFGMLFKMEAEDTPYNAMNFESGRALDPNRNMRLELCYSIPTITPVSLQSFTATAINQRYTSIQFTTTNETNAAAINIERSYDGINFLLVDSIAPKGNVNSNQYSYSEKTNPNAYVSYYRLKLINKDGTYQYSNILSLQLLSNNTAISIYPNPAKKFIMVNSKNVSGINIIDNQGRLVSTRKGLNISSNLNKVDLNLNQGIYLLQILMTDSKIVNKKLVVE